MPKTSASGMLSDLKSRLGFARNDDDDYGYDDVDFDEYDDFDDDGYNAQDDREYAGYGSDYDDQTPVGAGGYQPLTTRSSRYGRPDSSPNLVSIDDVKAHTQASSGGTYGRDLIDNRAPAESSPAYNATMRDRGRQGGARSDGLDSLFEPTARPTYSNADSTGGYSSYSPSSNGRASARNLTVVKPISYADIERVSRALKAGDAVVLAMRNTPRDLVRRMLDFSFGAASVLDASIDSPADKVFVIARGAGLSEDEKRQLRSQGVL